MKKMWIKCEISERNVQNEIWIDVCKTIVINEFVWLHFGLKKIHVKVNKRTNENLRKTTFENPGKLILSPQLLEELMVKEKNTYQINVSNEKIEIGPVIGLLLGEQQYYYHDEVMKEFTDNLSKFHKIGGLVIAFKSCSVDWEKEMIYGLYFNHHKKRWEYGTFPIPTVVYQRAYSTCRKTVEKLKKRTNGKVFNSRRLSKWQLYRQLRKSPLVNQYLPKTVLLKKIEDFQKCLATNDKLILKPVGLSRGRGICIIQKVSNELFHLIDYHDGSKITEHSFSLKEVFDYVKNNKFIERNYLIQPYLSLAKINQSPWDIRVVMQKNEKFEWACHGIECRVAGLDDLVTNISRGGKALPISEAIKLSFGESIEASKIKKEMIRICKELCASLEKEEDLFAELGVDIALDTNLNYWIIEANVRPTYNGFKRHMNYNNYLHLCSAPISFASRLAGF